ncbi:uncharacterized protein LOC119577182 isoform X2 [Penaeus monodon]|uniref:uncharacterized protein LOC119577182 isoform X2 n=1 Tax=Penaeus monodon TaxID=6687 RepID=UPI0018A6FC52|nr:uncharacterized protein LOC119577182 isoform X2 [Penaeus monodon]
MALSRRSAAPALWLSLVALCLALEAASAGDAAAAGAGGGGGGGGSTPSGCPPEELTVYKVKLETHWSPRDFPKHYPEWRPPAQWSKLAGISHSRDLVLFRAGETASPEVKAFAETGRSDGFDKYGQGNDGALDVFSAPPIPQGVGETQSEFFVDGNHSRISLLSKIVPSPDWFVGVDSFELCEGGNWVDNVKIQVDPLDAGTDNGLTFTSPNWQTSPQEKLFRITANYPDHPAHSFYYPTLQHLPRIATFTITKMKEYTLSEHFDPVDGTAYDVVKIEDIAYKHYGDENHVSYVTSVRTFTPAVTTTSTTTTTTTPAPSSATPLRAHHRHRAHHRPAVGPRPSVTPWRSPYDTATEEEVSRNAFVNALPPAKARDVAANRRVSLMSNSVESEDEEDDEEEEENLENEEQQEQELAAQQQGEEGPVHDKAARTQAKHVARGRSSTPHKRIPTGDAMAVIDDIVKNYQKEQRRKMRKQRREQRRRRRMELRKIRPPRDCRVTEWSAWSACSKTCGIGEQTRTRTILKHARRGGKACPVLEETTWCGSAGACPRDYFIWS